QSGQAGGQARVLRRVFGQQLQDLRRGGRHLDQVVAVGIEELVQFVAGRGRRAQQLIQRLWSLGDGPRGGLHVVQAGQQVGRRVVVQQRHLAELVQVVHQLGHFGVELFQIAVQGGQVVAELLAPTL